MLFRETLIHLANEMKRETHGTQQPRSINTIDEKVSIAQRSDLLVQSIDQRFLKSRPGEGRGNLRNANVKTKKNEPQPDGDGAFAL